MDPTECTLPSLVVYWRVGRLGVGLPALEDAEAWLAPPERERLAGLRIEKRRRDWLLGRVNLKRLLVEMIAERTGTRPAPEDLFIDRRPSGAPVVRWFGRATHVGPDLHAVAGALTASNSHSHDRALAAAAWTDHVATGWQVAIGADLELVEPRSEGFVGDFLTPAEREFCGPATHPRRPLRANLVWSAKEAVLKVLQRGLSADTWWLTCLPDDDGPDPAAHDRQQVWPSVFLDPTTPDWRRFSVSCDPRLHADDVRFAGFWTEIDGFVVTLAIGAGTREPGRA